MKRYLVQHGEACAKEVDPERPLTAQGRADVERLAGFLQRAGVRVPRVIHSGKLRARQTAEGLAGAVAPGIGPEEVGFLGPNDAVTAHDWRGEDGDLLVVGHLPYLGRLVAWLVSGETEPPLTAFRPGSIVCLETVDDGAWRIAWMLRPELLP